MQRDYKVLDRINTLGAVNEEDRAFLERSCTISVAHLEDLIDPCLHVSVLFTKLCHLLLPIKQALGVEDVYFGTPVKVIEILRVMRNGAFYRFMTDNLPKCIINNRTTSVNVEIVIASLIVYATNKLRYQFSHPAWTK